MEIFSSMEEKLKKDWLDFLVEMEDKVGRALELQDCVVY